MHINFFSFQKEMFYSLNTWDIELMYLEKKPTDTGFKLNFLYKIYVTLKAKENKNMLHWKFNHCELQEPVTERKQKQVDKLDHRLQISTSWL